MSSEAPSKTSSMSGDRIAKVIARSGLCSRREAEAWITAGRVRLNGKVLTGPAVTVTGKDAIEVDGAPLPDRERTRLWLFHKPKGVLTAARDPEGRTVLPDLLPKELRSLHPVGRLDFNTEGLLLLTNDGGLKRQLELPSTGWLRRYRVRAFGRPDEARLDQARGGMEIEGISYGPMEIAVERSKGDNAWMTVGLREGKNREVKVVLGALGLQVNRLIRISYGPFQLVDLPPGDLKEIKGRTLRDQLGVKMIKAAGLDFDAPILREVREPKKAPAQKKRSGLSKMGAAKTGSSKQDAPGAGSSKGSRSTKARAANADRKAQAPRAQIKGDRRTTHGKPTRNRPAKGKATR